MSVSYNSGVVLGVKLEDIGFIFENISDHYELHDKKGKPTGKFVNEYSWKISFNGKEIIESKLYSDVIEELIDVKGSLKFLDLSCDGFDVDRVIIGVGLAHNGYEDYNVMKEFDVDDQFGVKTELKNQFGVDVEPKLYFYFNAS